MENSIAVADSPSILPAESVESAQIHTAPPTPPQSSPLIDPTPPSTTQFLDLNDDCIITILDALPAHDLYATAFTCQRINSLAHHAFKAGKCLNIVEMLHKYRFNELYHIERCLQYYGTHIHEIDFSYKSYIYQIKKFRQIAARNGRIFDYIAKYCGETLKILRFGNVYLEMSASHTDRPLFKQLEKLQLFGCHDLTLNNDWHWFTGSTPQSFLLEFNSTNLANHDVIFLQRLAPIDTLKCLLLGYRNVVNDTIATLCQYRQLKILKFIEINGINCDNSQLLEHLTNIEELVIESRCFMNVHKILGPLGSKDTLKRLKITYFVLDTPFVSSFRLYRALRSLTFHSIHSRIYEFNEFDNFAVIREFILENDCLNNHCLIRIVKQMINLDVLKLMRKQAYRYNVRLNEDTYYELVDIYRQRNRKLVVVCHKNYKHEISNEIIANNCDYVDVCYTDYYQFEEN